MKIDRHNTGNADRTVVDIARQVERFAGDIGDLKNLPLEGFYNYVRAMPYRRDPVGREVVSRPEYIMKYGQSLGRDCKKQSTLMASWAKLNGVPYRLCVVSGRPDKRPHHIFVKVNHGGKWIDADATYPDYKLGEMRPFTYRKEFEVLP